MAAVIHMVQKFATSVHPDSAPSIASTATTHGEPLDVELDAAEWCWLNNVTMLLALKTGQLLIVQLNLDKDTVQDIAITKSGAAPIASCLSVIGSQLLFIGSWQGDSLLVKFTSLQTQEEPRPVDISVAESKPEEELHDDDMMFFSGEKPPQSRMSQLQFTFSVVDSLLCIGPIRDIVTGAPPELESGTQHTSMSPQLVACVGSGRSGSLAVLRNGIVAEVLIEVPVPDIEAVWALKFHDETEHMPLAVTSYATDAYLLIATSTGTMVLQSGEELEEVSDKSDFEVSTRTVYADSMFGDTRIIQICPESIRLLKATVLQQEIKLDALLSQFETPSMAIDSPKPAEDQPAPESSEEAAKKAEEASMKKPSHVFYDFRSLEEDSLHEDFMMENSLLAGPTSDKMDLDASDDTLAIHSASVCDPLVFLLLSDGRALILQGEKDSAAPLAPLGTSIPILFLPPEGDGTIDKISAGCLYADTSQWLSNRLIKTVTDKRHVFSVVCRLSGLLEIYALPQMEVVFSSPAFPVGWKILQPSIDEIPKLDTTPKAVELRMECFQSESSPHRESLVSRPVLFALLEDGTLLAYTAFSTDEKTLQFRRLELGYAGDAAWSQIRHQEKPISARTSRMVRFSDLGERHPCDGIFLCGMAPVFFVFSQKGMHMHRLLVDGSVSAMTPFSNVNCPKGFILAMTNDQLKICSMHNERLDCPWPCSKIPLRCTPHKLAWYPDARLYSILTSRPVPFKNRLPEEEGGDAHAAAAYAVNEQTAKEKGTEEGYEIKIIVPGNWSSAWSFPLQSNEVGMAMKAVRLRNTTEEMSQSFVAVGTAVVISEDYPSSGRILLLEIVKEMSEEWEGRVAWSQECRAPVGIVAVLDGNLLMGIGNRLELCAWTGHDMTRLAFFDAPIFVTSANVMKSFVLFGDILKGIHFVWYTTPTSGHDTRAEAKEMVLLGKDFHQADVFATEFLVNGTMLRFISADGGKNLQMHGYHRDHSDSWNGRKLIQEYSTHLHYIMQRNLLDL